MKRPRPEWGWPVLLGLISMVGLVIGLLGDGVYDIAAGLAVTAPVVAIGWSLARARRGDWDR